jgi:hypothetical protein
MITGLGIGGEMQRSIPQSTNSSQQNIVDGLTSSSTGAFGWAPPPAHWHPPSCLISIYSRPTLVGGWASELGGRLDFPS